MKTKRWLVEIELVIDEESHPRKWVPDLFSDVLNFDDGENCIRYKYTCLDSQKLSNL
jgi:hypothetical protein